MHITRHKIYQNTCISIKIFPYISFLVPLFYIHHYASLHAPLYTSLYQRKLTSFSSCVNLYTSLISIFTFHFESCFMINVFVKLIYLLSNSLVLKSVHFFNVLYAANSCYHFSFIQSFFERGRSTTVSRKFIKNKIYSKHRQYNSYKIYIPKPSQNAYYYT